MKYIILIGDGMGDYPRSELGGKTPLAAARTPNMDALANKSLVGTSRTIPHNLPPGSDAANMALMGYDPLGRLTGRGPLEAASMGVGLGPDDVAFRTNLVVLTNDSSGKPLMRDYCSDHIATGAASKLIQGLNKELADETFQFHVGTSFRHVLVWKNGRDDCALNPPHDHIGRPIDDQLEALSGECPALFGLIKRSWSILPRLTAAMSISAKPNSIWPWGQGKPPAMSPLADRFGLSGAVISAVDLIKGLGVYAGLEVVNVPGASGWLDTNYAGKLRASLKILEELDFLYLHVEAPDEAGHSGSLRNKLQAIEDFDAHIVGPLVKGLDDMGEWRMVLACDHYTPLELRTHTSEPVPVLIHDSRTKLGEAPVFSEKVADAAQDLGPAHRLIERLLERN